MTVVALIIQLYNSYKAHNLRHALPAMIIDNNILKSYQLTLTKHFALKNQLHFSTLSLCLYGLLLSMQLMVARNW